MDLFDRIDAVRAERDVLAHPFYQRWSAGELTRQDLALYAAQYRHAVVALADATHAAAAEEASLAPHAEEEAAHVALWDQFVAAVGGRPEAASAETAGCAAAWSAADTPLELLVGIYAIEASQPAISAVKAQGLREFYGVAETEYFDLHAERDLEHAAEGRDLIAARLAGADEDALVARAEAVLAANWELLDGVERRLAA